MLKPVPDTNKSLSIPANTSIIILSIEKTKNPLHAHSFLTRSVHDNMQYFTKTLMNGILKCRLKKKETKSILAFLKSIFKSDA